MISPTACMKPTKNQQHAQSFTHNPFYHFYSANVFYFFFLLNLYTTCSRAYLWMLLLKDSTIPVALTFLYVLDRLPRMSNPSSMTTRLPFMNRLLRRAFHIRSSVFILLSLYPLRLYIVRSVDTWKSSGRSTFAVTP